MGLCLLLLYSTEYLFALGRKSRCDRFREDLNKLVPINNPGELRWYAGCHFSRHKKQFADNFTEGFYRQDRGEVWYCRPRYINRPDDIAPSASTPCYV